VTRRTIFFATAAFAAACVRPAAPTVTPVPSAPVSSAPTPAPAPVVQQAQPFTEAARDTASVVSSRDSGLVSRVSGISPTDVARRATEVFGGDSVPAPAAAPDSAMGPSWDISVREYESTDRVEHYVRLFSGKAKEHLEQQLERGTRYEPMIRAKMREGGLPEDMYYLALIESGFDPNAYSRAAAVGMWQFMTSTGRDMGLRVDWWVDERRDPVKSTTAAVRFIKGLREQFGSLYLAAAAYNGGPGRVARGLSRYADDLEGTSGEDLFFALAEKDYLRNETRDYVPQLIAAALIAKEPERYGMHYNTLPAFVYDSVRVGGSTPLAAVAHAANAGVDAVRELNPQVLRGMTPPRDSSWLRIPPGGAEGFGDRFAELPKSEKTGLFTVETRKGQTLDAIAEKNGIAVHKLALYNPSLKHYKSGRLVPGQAVLVPTAAVAMAAASVPDPSIERYGSSSKATAVHVVKSGETLSGIAKKYKTTTAVLMKRNGLRKPLIFPGQSLVVGGKGAVKATAKDSKKSKRPVAKKSPPPTKKKPVAPKKPTKKPTKKASKNK
jgi:membrane-bound lytic murein transglycosylase D